VAWMSVMGTASVGYHEHAVACRGDDPVQAALGYYASRGEAPMVWGGTGRFELGLDGEVDLAEWRAVFGPGGACDPVSRETLVACRRPGIELVVSPHKSVAELGVIGRAEDMHAIVDAERDATMGYLDRLVCEEGGRRGRAGVRAPTGGLIWAVSRHATTRAGDPQVHDHVLVANVVSMRDTRCGWKALDTAFVRDHLHAATAVGRIAAAAKAVELGYGIEADPGRSGRLGGWAIAGVPRQAWEIHANRSSQIDAAAGADSSYRSRSVAARATRDRKVREQVVDLVARWRSELAAAGHPPPELEARVAEAALEYRPPDVSILDGLPEELLSPGGRLATDKTFTREDVIIAAAPILHGLPVSILDEAVDRVLSHELAVALPAVSGARQAVYTAACVIQDEKRIAALAETLTALDGPAVGPSGAAAAIAGVESDRGLRLTGTQQQVAAGLLTSGRRLEVVIGVAGSGKTTTLAAVRAGFEAAGYRVIGAATSGQAARTLGEGAGIESRTVASWSWRLDHDRLRLGGRDVLILDEAGMTTDSDLGRLLSAVESSRAKMIVVGDYHQLDSVGPGGALEAIAGRHPEIVSVLSDNLRQEDLGERIALEHLRSGSVQRAVEWYLAHGRVHAAGGRPEAIEAMVQAWAADITAGRDSVLLAYRRNNVDALNHAARSVWQQMGRLSGPEVDLDDGRAFQAGDRVITLATGPGGAWTTSQTASVVSVDPDSRSLIAETPDGRRLHMEGEHLGSDKLAYGYAITAHRSQGATIDAAHVLGDGGGRELAYVAMSRARTTSHIYLATPPARLADRLTLEWQTSRRQTWTLHDRPRKSAELRQERSELLRSIPADQTAPLRHLQRERDLAARHLHQLYSGSGPWEHTQAGVAARQLEQARQAHEQAARRLDNKDLGWRACRRADKDLAATKQHLAKAQQNWRLVGEPVAQDRAARLEAIDNQIAHTQALQHERDQYIAHHPEIIQRLDALDRAIQEHERIEHQQDLERLRQQELERRIDNDLHHHLGQEPENHHRSHEHDLGLSL
jgi:conjugative relaxase-like TrwC/TraI family protein